MHIITRSELMLKDPCTIAYFCRVVHCGSGGGTAQYPSNGWQAVKKAISVANHPMNTYTARHRTMSWSRRPRVKRVYIISIHTLIVYITLSIACSEMTTILEPYIRSCMSLAVKVFSSPGGYRLDPPPSAMIFRQTMRAV